MESFPLTKKKFMRNKNSYYYLQGTFLWMNVPSRVIHEPKSGLLGS